MSVVLHLVLNVDASMAVFNEGQLQAIAQALGETANGLTNSEIDELLQLCRVQDEYGSGTKWRRIYLNLWNQQSRDGHRKTILGFIRKAMRPERYLRNPERFATIRTDLNKALSFAGLFLDEAGQLHSVDKVDTLPEAERRARELRHDLEARGVHLDVLAFCRAELVADDYFHAAQEATKSIFDKLRTLTGLVDDGGALVDATLSGQSPMLAINRLTTESEWSEQRGFANLLRGVYGMFRNPTAHEARVKWMMSREDAEDLLSLASLAHRRLDTAKRLR
jgi:uncharacterized protein (TIGR02391 family)